MRKRHTGHANEMFVFLRDKGFLAFQREEESRSKELMEDGDSWF